LGQVVATSKRKQRSLWALSHPFVLPDERVVLLCKSMGSKVAVWNWKEGKETTLAPNTVERILGTYEDPTYGTLLVLYMVGGGVDLWSLTTGNLIRREAFAYHSYVQGTLCEFGVGTARFLDVSTDPLTRSTTPHPNPLVIPPGRLLTPWGFLTPQGPAFYHAGALAYVESKEVKESEFKSDVCYKLDDRRGVTSGSEALLGCKKDLRVYDFYENKEVKLPWSSFVAACEDEYFLVRKESVILFSKGEETLLFSLAGKITYLRFLGRDRGKEKVLRQVLRRTLTYLPKDLVGEVSKVIFG